MVKIKSIKDMLAESSFFEGMDESYIDLLSGCGSIAHFKKDEIIMKEGENADSFYLIRQGDVMIESQIPSGVLSVSKTGVNGVVGFSWLFHPYRNQFDARALQDVEAIRLDGKCLRGKAEEDHELGYQFMKRFAEIMLSHMHSARRQMLDIYGESEKVA
jgi:CRP-like cAMP-binding protein